MRILILHSKYDEASRKFIVNIPKDGNEYQIVDWYGVHAQEGHVCNCIFGEPYIGPHPSAFPELIFREEDSPEIKEISDDGTKEVTIKPAPCWIQIHAAQSFDDLKDRKKFIRKPDRQGVIVKEEDIKVKNK